VFAQSFVVISCSPGLKAIVYSLDLGELEPTHSKQRWEDQFDYKSSVLGPVDGTLCETLMHASLDDLSCLEQYSKIASFISAAVEIVQTKLRPALQHEPADLQDTRS
jgi:hypothetical protein